MNDSPAVLSSRPNSSGGTTANNDMKSTTTELTRPSTSCTCSPHILEDSDIPPVPQIDPESSAKIPVLSVTPTKSLLAVVADPVSRQPSPMLKADELELKDAYLAGYKHVEELFHKLLESLNFYKRKAGSLEIEVQQLKDAKAALEERIKDLQEETQGWETKMEEREKRKEGKAINKVRMLIRSATTKRRSTPEGVNIPPTMVEAK
ncbi:hypothetical protein Q9L58_009287 [Maublancomyces gigas]|uniref:Uncharacterized protein n=1 Tax=Discina gigas TaxID=1032678 RepID=A0ABR3G7D3_9PEZI